jgi:hypothetical protein
VRVRFDAPFFPVIVSRMWSFENPLIARSRSWSRSNKSRNLQLRLDAARTDFNAMQEVRRRQSLAARDDPEWSVKLSY